MMKPHRDRPAQRDAARAGDSKPALGSKSKVGEVLTEEQIESPIQRNADLLLDPW